MRATSALLNVVTLILLSCAFSQHQASAQAKAERKEACSVKGVVTAAASDLPLKSALVTLRKEGESLQQFTDALGHFEFTGLPAGLYEVHASKTGYVSGAYRLAGGDIKETLELEAGRNVDEVQFQLVQASVILGRVTDEHGEPMPGVEMDALSPGVFINDGILTDNAGRFSVTNDLGEYRIYGLLPGRYYLAANISAHSEFMNSDLQHALEGNSQTIYFPGVKTKGEAQKISVQPGQEIKIDFPLRAYPLLTISGRVLAPSGRPPRVALVRIQRQEAAPGLLPHSMESCWTDQEGNFSFREVLPGSYIVAVKLDPRTGFFDTKDEKLYWAEEHVEVASGSISNLALQLKASRNIAGRLVAADGAELRSRDLIITLDVGDEHIKDYLEAGVLGSEIEKNGAFNIKKVLPAKYRLRVRLLPDGYYVSSAFFGAQNVLEAGLDLSDGVESDEVLKITVKRGTGRIDGSVSSGEGPVPGALVRISPDPANSNHQSVPDERAGGDGHFIIKNLPPGNYLLRAYSNAVDDDDDPPSDRVAIAQVTLTENDSKTVQLRLAKRYP